MITGEFNSRPLSATTIDESIEKYLLAMNPIFGRRDGNHKGGYWRGGERRGVQLPPSFCLVEEGRRKEWKKRHHFNVKLPILPYIVPWKRVMLGQVSIMEKMKRATTENPACWYICRSWKSIIFTENPHPRCLYLS